MARKPWMRELKAFRFNKDGTMTQETARGWSKAMPCYLRPSNQYGDGIWQRGSIEGDRKAYDLAMELLREHGPDTPYHFDPARAAREAAEAAHGYGSFGSAA